MRRAAAVLVFGASLVAGCSGGEHEGVQVVQDYAKARQDGDAAKACSLLTRGQRFEMVARVTQNWSAARASQCEQHVLQQSDLSTAVDADVPQMADQELQVSLIEGGGGGQVHLKGRPDAHPALEVFRDNGTWRVDGQGSEKWSFLLGCKSQFSEARCGCAYELMRVSRATESGPARAQRVAAETPGALQRCAATGDSLDFLG